MNDPSTYTIHYEHPLALYKLSTHLQATIPLAYDHYVVLCIGTDRSTGDSLGPLTGSLLTQRNPHVLDVYGTLHEPVHALNLEQRLAEVKERYVNPFIIAVDASLGRSTSIGTVHCGLGPLKPGLALNKQLPDVGDIHLSGIVNVGTSMNFLILQSTRLSIVHDMANIIAKCLFRLDIMLRDRFTLINHSSSAMK